MRLDKYLWELGSRSQIKKLLKTGVVCVDGEIAKDPAAQVNDSSSVTYMGKEHKYREYIYLVMNKPKGVVSATFDNHLPTVIDIIPEEYKKFNPFPVGRLDIDTEGLLIITNDGKLSHELTSPKKDLFKRYIATTDIPMEEKDIDVFKSGMDLGDFTAKPGNLELTDDPYKSIITISEGKFHQVKRMCEKCGKTVKELTRISIGEFSLPKSLMPGDTKEVSKQELMDLIYTQR